MKMFLIEQCQAMIEKNQQADEMYNILTHLVDGLQQREW
jgi:hypothetical protein